MRIRSEVREELEVLVSRARSRRTAVAAAVTTTTGNTYYGVNVESSCHSLSICAERAAVFAAVTAEGPNMIIVSVDVLAIKDGAVLDILPCGGCRQVISEFSSDLTTLMGKSVTSWLPSPYK